MKSAKLSAQIASPQTSAPSASRLRPASSTGLRPRFWAMLPTIQSESMLNRKAMPTLVPARPSWPESSLAATAPTVAFRGSAALTKICAPASLPVARTTSRGMIGSAGAELTPQACRTQRAPARSERARYPDVRVSHELWFLWLFLGLKIPLIGLFYFIFRVLKKQDEAWEHGEYDGGGATTTMTAAAASPASGRPTPPGGPGIRRRQPRPKAPQPALRGMPLRTPPRRRAEPLRTHDPRPLPERQT